MAGSDVTALTGYGTINSKLYAKRKDGTYYQLSYDKFYVNGTVSTIHKRGAKVSGLYKSGGEETVWLRGNLIETALYYPGTKRVVFTPATCDATTTVLAYAI